MAEHDVTKADLERFTGINLSTIKRILDEPEHNYNISSISAIARALQVGVTEIIQD